MLTKSGILGFEEKVTCTITLYFGMPAEKTVDSRPTFDFIQVSGRDLIENQNKLATSGYGALYGVKDLSEMHRRTGITMERLKEAVGTLKDYRLHGGLLQRLWYSRGTGTWEYLTVIPEGNWRTVPFGTTNRKLSLRRYIILVFHNTAMGPHRGRERTFQAIIDAGCWWPSLYRDVQATVRSCPVCRTAKDHTLVTGHQRSRDYDGPFRYLVIDYVGPMQPTTPRNNRYMFTCACAWSGWYWAFPTEDDTSETAARYLFYNVMCDLADYPVCILSLIHI